MGKAGQRYLTATENIWSWTGTKILVFCNVCNSHTNFVNLQRGFFLAGNVTLSKHVIHFGPR